MTASWAQQLLLLQKLSAEDPHGALLVGAEMGFELEPRTETAYAQQTDLFKFLLGIRRHHGLTLFDHLAYVNGAEVEHHPLLLYQDLSSRLMRVKSEAEQAEVLGRMGRLLYTMGWLEDAEQCFFDALCLADDFGAKAGRLELTYYHLRNTRRSSPAWAEHWELTQVLLAELTVLSATHSVIKEFTALLATQPAAAP